MSGAPFQWRAYSLPLRAPLQLKGGALDRREGFLVRVETPSGGVGWGDAAPLPGFSRETPARVRAELDALRAGSGGLDGCSSSVRFAVESAQAGAEAASRGATLGEFLLGRAGGRCAVNALFDGAPDTWAGAARAAAADGFSVVKVKVGRTEIAREAAALRAAAGAAPGLRWRLDANRGWSDGEALAFARALAGLAVDYIEEPFRGGGPAPAGWPESVGIALDESLHGDGAPPGARGGVCAWVIKPTLCGGLSRSLDLVRAAWAAGITPVVSAACESGVGIRVLAELAAALGTVAGLDTYRALGSDVLAPPLRMAGGALDLAAARLSEVAA